MLIRVVKMVFKTTEITDFLARLEQNVPIIRQFEGCRHLQILQDQKNPCIVFTYSHWESEEYLNAYRNSDFFQVVLTATKKGFAEKPQAWSLDSVYHLA